MVRTNFFRSWKVIPFLNSAFISKILYASLIALATGYAAQIKFFLPWTPVPITLQTFVVLAAGYLLGKWWGSFSQLSYLMFGILGVPFFAGMQGGIMSLLGPRGGYLLGFVLTAYFVGRYFEHRPRASFAKTIFILSWYSTLFIYGLGCSWLGGWLYLAKGSIPSFSSVLMMGMIPFIPGDLIKIFLLALLSRVRKHPKR